MASMRWLFALSLLWPNIFAQNVSIFSMDDVPAWQKASLMHLQIGAPESRDAAQLVYDVYPLTANVGLNQSSSTRNAVWIRGNLVYAEYPAAYGRLRDPDPIAFLSCDFENSTEVFQQVLVDSKPRAVLLYSLRGNCCGMTQVFNFNYTSVFTMANSEEAIGAMNNTRQAGGIASATILGDTNTTDTDPVVQERGGNNSAVAMSILYSITGLITLLFLVIIGTGAFRAHRYPERYGPRSGYGGRPRQSRAKGLARAVLETLPIVKFGDPAPAKPDPALELESQISRSSPEPGMGTRLSAIPEEPKTPMTPMKRQSEIVPMSGAVQQDSASQPSAAMVTGLSSIKENDDTIQDSRPSEEHLGCSICTEDFTVGEDVRVLPCDHKFHPACIDPWLVNVSGTCPLCRLDLRPQSEQGILNSGDLVPPLADEWNGNPATGTAAAATTTQQRRRSYRLLDLHRLRQASVEERIEILRRHRSQQQELSAAASSTELEEQRGRRASLADRLKDKFRVRTRAQSPDPLEPTTSEGQPTTTAAAAATTT
ncbi:E3 ubiquitin-protein ligase SDIR1 [Cladorrhinum sp. PSN259]|nr:E3 ubiquitin-protein ligase SDIR1 [Cladorrhinum sp. PSN259]